jgi:MFS family permease
VLSIPGSPRLFASALVARLPQGMGSLAILLLVRVNTHSYAAAGFAVGAFALATAAMAPIQGRLVDRFGRMRVLVPSGIGQGSALALLVLAATQHASAVALVLLSGLAGALLPPIAASVRALLGEIVEDSRVRDAAYAVDSVAQELVWITGPLLVAAAISLSSPAGAVLMLAAVCMVGTTLFVRSPLARDRARTVRQHERVSALSSNELRALLAPVLLVGTGLGAIEVGLPSLALHAGSRSASGLLLALWSVGSVVGGLWYGGRSWRLPLASRYRTLLMVAVVCTAPLIGARSIPAGALCSLVAGLTIAPMFSCQYALVSRLVRPGSETEAFTWMSAALISGLAIGSAAGGVVIGAGGVGAPFALACAATAAAAVLSIRVSSPAQVAVSAQPDPRTAGSR